MSCVHVCLLSSSWVCGTDIWHPAYRPMVFVVLASCISSYGMCGTYIGHSGTRWAERLSTDVPR
eukprot:2293511-Rhodomonas_salina.1